MALKAKGATKRAAVEREKKSEMRIDVAMRELAREAHWFHSCSSGILPVAPYSAGLIRSRARVNRCASVRGDGLKGFDIAGVDRRWKIAVAEIVGPDKAWVSHPDVPMPMAGRYAWVSDPECDLYNGDGLPASPFCGDDGPAYAE
jgi:hypothetical protein